MKTRNLWIGVNLLGALLLSGVLLAQTQESLFATWKLDLSKSKYDPGPAPKANTVKFEAYQGGLKVTTDNVTAKGEIRHWESTGKFDAKDNPVIGNPDTDTTSYSKIDGHTYDTVQKKNGKTTVVSHFVISADGKVRISTQTGTNGSGAAIHNTLYYDKE